MARAGNGARRVSASVCLSEIENGYERMIGTGAIARERRAPPRLRVSLGPAPPCRPAAPAALHGRSGHSEPPEAIVIDFMRLLGARLGSGTPAPPVLRHDGRGLDSRASPAGPALASDAPDPTHPSPKGQGRPLPQVRGLPLDPRTGGPRAVGAPPAPRPSRAPPWENVDAREARASGLGRGRGFVRWGAAGSASFGRTGAEQGGPPQRGCRWRRPRPDLACRGPLGR